jgi:selenide,water dikinase
MGAEPRTALNIVGFPRGTMPIEVLGEILRGGGEKAREAGVVVIGGHSIIDDEVKYGLSVTGRVHPKKLLTNAAATAGDQLVLTKPLGTGLLATAMKQGKLAAPAADALYANMTRLNAHAADAAIRVGARCATDVTGFGLLGHAYHLARASKVTLTIDRTRVPLLPEARALATSGLRTGGLERNEAYLASRISWGAADAIDKALLQDPQTSGGLLVAVPAVGLANYLSAVDGAVHIGEVTPGTGAVVVV